MPSVNVLMIQRSTVAERAKGRDVGYWYLVGGGLCLLVVWCVATVAGVAFATAIPEPGSLLLAATGMMALAGATWRRRRFLASERAGPGMIP